MKKITAKITKGLRKDRKDMYGNILTLRTLRFLPSFAIASEGFARFAVNKLF